VRILIAPVEIAGQMQILAEALRAQGYSATAVSHAQTNYLGGVNDISLGLSEHDGRVRRLARKLVFFIWATSHYDLFHFFFGRSLLPGYVDLPILRRLGKKIVVHCHGSDIRNPYVLYHRRALAKGELAPDHPAPDLSLAVQRRHLRTWRKYAQVHLVSTPDLKAIVPEAILIPQALPLLRWSFEPQLQHRLWKEQPIRIVHAPTDRAKKGTEFILGSIERLQARGRRVDLVLVEGKSREQAQRIYHTCHMGIDQLFIGSVSTFAVELMALGKPVLSNLSSDLEKAQPALPIVNVSVHDLDQKIEVMIANTQHCLELGQTGRMYVEENHAADKIARQLLDIYQAI